MTGPDVSSYLYMLLLLFVSSNHIRIACGHEQPGGNNGHLMVTGNNDRQFTQPEGSGRQVMQPATNQRQPMRPGDGGLQSIQPSGNLGQSMQPGESRAQPVQPGSDWRQPGQPSGNRGPSIQPGGIEGQNTSPGDYRRPPSKLEWNFGQPGQQGGNWRPPMQIKGTGGRPIQPGGNISPATRPGWNKGQSGQPGGNWNQPMQTGGTGGTPMKPGGNMGQPLPSGGIWRPPMQLQWNTRPVMPESGSGGNRLPQPGFPVGPNRVGNKKQQSDPPTKDQRIKSIFKLVSRNLNYQRVPRTVLLLGNPASGKTTLALLLTGETNFTLAQETLDKSFIFEDPFGRIGNRTTYPEEFMSPKNISFYDWPPLGYNEDEDEVEIAYVSRANEAYDSIESFRVLLVVRQCYKACSIGEKIGTAYHSLTNLARLLTDFEWYKDSIGIVYNKVTKDDGSPATERDPYVKVLQEVLEGVKKMAMQDIAKTDDPNIIDYLERTIEFADMLKDDNKIAVFPTPSQLSEKPHEDTNIVRGLQETATLLKALDCTVKRETIYHPMSSDVESTVKELKEYTTKHAVKSVSKSIRSVAVELRRQEEKTFGIHSRRSFYLPRKATLENATNSILESSNLSNLLLALRQATKQLNFNVSFSESNVGLRLTGYAYFFAGLTGSDVEYDNSEWYESFANLSQLVSENAAWYDFLVDVYENFSEETFQKKKELYNVSDIAKFWGTGPEGNGLQISAENFQTFFGKASELFPSLVKHLMLNSTVLNEEQIHQINVVIRETVRSVTGSLCDANMTITTGSYIFLNDTTWEEYSKCGQVQNVLIFGFRKIFAGESYISISHKLSLISPEIVVSGMKILQKGEDGGSPDDAATKILPLDDDCSLFEAGAKGLPGSNGMQPQDILVVSGLIAGSGKLIIQSFGGDGGVGQNGEKVLTDCLVQPIGCPANLLNTCEKKYDGLLLCPNCWGLGCQYFNDAEDCKWLGTCSRLVSNMSLHSIGGEGGFGGFPGNVLAITKQEFMQSIRPRQFHGKIGQGGRGQTIGYNMSNYYGKVVVCDAELSVVNPNPPPAGIKLDATLATNITYALSAYWQNSFEAINLANVHTITSFWDFISSHEDLSRLYDSKAFAYEAKTVIPLWIAGESSPVQEDFYVNYLKSVAERIREFLRTRKFKQPKVFCGEDLESNEYESKCADCQGNLCETKLIESIEEDKNKENLKALASFLTSISSQLVNVKRKGDNTLVTDIDSFMDVTYEKIEDYKKNKDMAEAAIKMREANKQYRDNINKKIADASDIIKNQLQPEIDYLNALVEQEVTAVIHKLKEIIEEAKKKTKELEKYRDQAQRAMIAHGIFGTVGIIGGIVGLFGPEGAAIGGALTAGAGAGSAVFDAVNGTPPKDRITQLAKETSESNTRMEEFFKKHQGKKLKQVNDLFNDAQTAFEKISTTPSNLKAKKDFTEKKAEYDSLRNSSPPDFVKMRQIRKDIREIIERVARSGKGGKTSTALALTSKDNKKPEKPEEPEDPVKSGFETLGKSLKIVEDSVGVFNKVKGDYDTMQECENAIDAVGQELENLRKMEDYANGCIMPMVTDVQDLSNKYKNGQLQEDSLAKLDVAGWKMQSSISDLRDQMQEFTKALKIDSSGVVQATNKLSDIMKVVFDIYARMETWNEQRELGDYMYTLFVSAQNIKIPTDLQIWVDEVSRIAERTAVLFFYNKALNALIQFSFPMAHRLQPYMQIPITSHNIDDYIDEIQKSFKSLKQELKLEKAVVGGGQDEFRRRDMFYDTYSSTPFAFFDAEEHHNGVLSLFDQEPITLFADILDFELPYDALKFYVVDLIIRVREGEPDWEKKDAELQNALAFYSISLTHTGNNYFRFGGKFYVLQTPSLRIVYNYFKLNGVVYGKNAIYEKLEKGDETLSPFTLWEVKLTKLKDDKRADLTPFMDLKIDLLLCGMGTYIHQEIYETGEDFFTENYYMPDETLGNIARKKLEDDSRILSGNRLLRVVKRGGGYQVVTSEETKNLNPHLLSRPTPFFQSEMLSPNIHKNWDNASVTSGFYHQARR